MIDISALSGGQLVAWYLMASYLYYHCDTDTPLSDEQYDQLCARLDAEWKHIKHPHKKLIDRKSLSAGTGYYIPLKKYPLMVCSAAWSWRKHYTRSPE